MSDGIAVTLVLDLGRRLQATYDVTLAALPTVGSLIVKDEGLFMVREIVHDLDEGKIRLDLSRAGRRLP